MMNKNTKLIKNTKDFILYKNDFESDIKHTLGFYKN